MGRAIVLINDLLVRGLLQVPDDVKIIGTAFDPMRMWLIVHIESDRLPDVPHGVIAPIVTPEAHIDRHMNDDLEWEVRTFVDWPLPTPASE